MDYIELNVKPGICGFDCIVKAENSDKMVTKVEISESDCKMIQKLSSNLGDISMQDLFAPLTKNPIFIAAEQAGCHLACPVPVAIVKACEVTLGLAIKKDVTILFHKE